MLSNDKCNAVPTFNALTRCDATSSYAGRGNLQLGQCGVFAKVTSAFCSLIQKPTPANIGKLLSTIERFIMLLYEYGNSDDKVSRARETLFTRRAGRWKRYYQHRMPYTSTSTEWDTRVYGTRFCLQHHTFPAHQILGGYKRMNQLIGYRNGYALHLRVQYVVL